MKRSDRGGGNYPLNERYKLGLVFSDAVMTAVHSDSLSYWDAYGLTGMSASSFKEYPEEVMQVERYLLDSNIFIQSERYIPMDLFPSFWNELGKLFASGTAVLHQTVSMIRRGRKTPCCLG